MRPNALNMTKEGTFYTNRRVYNCHCLPYGQIDPKKIERLKKRRQKRICPWKELIPFAEDERKDDTHVASTGSSRLLFPPIHNKFTVSMKSIPVSSYELVSPRNQLKNSSTKNKIPQAERASSQMSQVTAVTSRNSCVVRERNYSKLGEYSSLPLQEVEGCLVGITPRDVLDHGQC